MDREGKPIFFPSCLTAFNQLVAAREPFGARGNISFKEGAIWELQAVRKEHGDRKLRIYSFSRWNSAGPIEVVFLLCFWLLKMTGWIFAPSC